MSFLKSFSFALLFCCVGMQTTQAQGAMIELIPTKISVEYLNRSGLNFVLYGFGFKAVAAGRLSNKVYLGGRAELTIDTLHSPSTFVSFTLGPFVNYYPWGKGEFTTWHDQLYFIGALSYRTNASHRLGGISPFLGVGYDFRVGKRKAFAISPELAYYAHSSDEGGTAHVLALNVKLKLFTGKAKLLPPKSPRRAIR